MAAVAAVAAADMKTLAATAMAGVTDNNQPKLAAEEMAAETDYGNGDNNNDGKDNDGSNDNGGGHGISAQQTTIN